MILRKKYNIFQYAVIDQLIMVEKEQKLLKDAAINKGCLKIIKLGKHSLDMELILFI